MLLLNLIESPIGRVPIITQTFNRIRLCFRMKVRFSESFLASYRINQRKNTKIYMSLLLTRVEVDTKGFYGPSLVAGST